LTSSRFRVVVFDLDGTLLRGTTVSLHLAEWMGRRDAVLALEERFHAGEISNAVVAVSSASWFEGTPKAAVWARLERAAWIEGLAETLSALSAAGATLLLATITWRFAAELLGERYGFAAVSGTEMGEHAGILSGRVTRHFDEDDKLRFVEQWCERHGVELEQVAAIGDSRSDLPLFRRAGLAVALNAGDDAKAAAHVAVDTDDLRDVLPLLLAHSPSREVGEVHTSVDYDERQYAVYARGRALSPAQKELWAGVLARHLGHGTPLTLLDLGSGAGRWAQFIAERFDCDVIGVEPSWRMRDAAAREHAHRRVRYIEGSAERIPLPDRSCDVAWLSDVAHHIDDPDACAHELRRLLPPQGLVLVRGILPNSIGRAAFLTFFPTARPIAEAQAAATAELVRRLDHGFQPVARETIEQQVAPSLPAYYDRVALRAISTLELISDAEFEAGLARMRAAARVESVPQPVAEPADLITLQRRPSAFER
jgi:phosphoserine phosphatase